jgi:hypothetical protein
MLDTISKTPSIMLLHLSEVRDSYAAPSPFFFHVHHCGRSTVPGIIPVDPAAYSASAPEKKKNGWFSSRIVAEHHTVVVVHAMRAGS